MESIIYILLAIGIIVLVFSLWSFIIIINVVKKKNYRNSNDTLGDKRFFELKSRQDFIIAIGTVLFSLSAFVGISSLKEIKQDLSEQFDNERIKIDSLNFKAMENFLGLENRGEAYKDSVFNALLLVNKLQDKVKAIYEKDVIRQNIFIVDPIVMGDLGSRDKDEFRTVYFKNLRTISGERLPKFNTAPSIVCFSTNFSVIVVKDINSEYFKVKPDFYAADGADDTGNKIRFSVWISQKPNKEFSEEFSDEFN